MTWAPTTSGWAMADMALSIRDAGPADFPQVERLIRMDLQYHAEHRPDLFHADGFGYGWEEFERLLADPGRIALLAEVDGETAGLCKAVFAFSLILAVVILLTTPHGMPLVPLPWGYIGTGSLLAALTVIVRLMAAAIPLFLVFYVTKMNDITNAVVKVLHVPYKYAFTFTSTIHFIPMFMNDMKGIMEAQTARGVEFDAGGIVRKVRLMVPLCVPLLVSSVRKTNSAAIAAEVRGFNLRTATSGYKEYPFVAADVAAMAGSLALVAIAVALGVLL